MLQNYSILRVPLHSGARTLDDRLLRHGRPCPGLVPMALTEWSALHMASLPACHGCSLCSIPIRRSHRPPLQAHTVRDSLGVSLAIRTSSQSNCGPSSILLVELLRLWLGSRCPPRGSNPTASDLGSGDGARVPPGGKINSTTTHPLCPKPTLTSCIFPTTIPFFLVTCTHQIYQTTSPIDSSLVTIRDYTPLRKGFVFQLRQEVLQRPQVFL